MNAELKVEFTRKFIYQFLWVSGVIFLIWLFTKAAVLKLGAAVLLVLLGWMAYKFRRHKGSLTKSIRDSFLLEKPEKRGLIRFLKQIIQAEKSFTKWLSAPFARSHEKRNPYATTFYFILVILILLILFDKNLLILSLIPLAIGDTFSTLIGLKFGRRKLIGNKTLEGSLTYFITTFAAVFLLSTYVPGFAILLPLILSILIAGLSTLVELIPVEDNISVPIATCLVLWLVTFLV